MHALPPKLGGKRCSSDKIELLAGHLRKGIGVISLDPAIHDNLLWCRRLQNQDMDPSAKHPILLPAEGKAVRDKVRHGGRQHVLSDLVRSATVRETATRRPVNKVVLVVSYAQI